MKKEKCKGRIRPLLTREDRSQIKIMLDERKSLQQIADKIGKSHSTISREIRSRRIDSDRGAVGRVRYRCVRRRECDKRRLRVRAFRATSFIHPVQLLLHTSRPLNFSKRPSSPLYPTHFFKIR